MKKILVSIVHYDYNNKDIEYRQKRFLPENQFFEIKERKKQCLLKNLSSYNAFKNYEITINLYLTEDINCDEFCNLNIHKHIFDYDIKSYLGVQHKQLFIDNINNYDYFIYTEEDILITEENIDTYILVQKELPIPFICGFLVYELKNNDDYLYLIENHPMHAATRGGYGIIKTKYQIDNQEYFEPYNIHSACYIIDKDLLQLILTYKYKEYIENINNYAGILEGACTNIYYKTGLIKIIPKKYINQLLVHHMGNEYVTSQKDVYTKETTPNPEKFIL